MSFNLLTTFWCQSSFTTIHKTAYGCSATCGSLTTISKMTIRKLRITLPSLPLSITIRTAKASKSSLSFVTDPSFVAHFKFSLRLRSVRVLCLPIVGLWAKLGANPTLFSLDDWKKRVSNGKLEVHARSNSGLGNPSGISVKHSRSRLRCMAKIRSSVFSDANV